MQQMTDLALGLVCCRQHKDFSTFVYPYILLESNDGSSGTTAFGWKPITAHVMTWSTCAYILAALSGLWRQGIARAFLFVAIGQHCKLCEIRCPDRCGHQAKGGWIQY